MSETCEHGLHVSNACHDCDVRIHAEYVAAIDESSAVHALRARFGAGPLAAHVAGLLGKLDHLSKAWATSARHQQRADILRNVIRQIATEQSASWEADIQAAFVALQRDTELRAQRAGEIEAIAQAAVLVASRALREAEMEIDSPPRDSDGQKLISTWNAARTAWRAAEDERTAVDARGAGTAPTGPCESCQVRGWHVGGRCDGAIEDVRTKETR